MSHAQAVLLDLYGTALTCDFRSHDVELPRLAGAEGRVWNERSRELTRVVMDGHMTLAEAFADVIACCGGSATSDLVAALVRRDQELLVQGASLYADTIPFLRRLREHGIKIALVSNCAENTRALVDHFGLSPLLDAVVLSCEVGCSKPSPEIFQLALRELGVEPQDALLIDDQQTYCDGAAELGIAVVRIDRAAATATAGVVTALSEVEPMLGRRLANS